jgi:hypothetical protein
MTRNPSRKRPLVAREIRLWIPSHRCRPYEGVTAPGARPECTILAKFPRICYTPTMNLVQLRRAWCCLLPAVPSPGGGPTTNTSRLACLLRIHAPAATRRPVRREAHCQAPTPHPASPRRQRCGTRHRKKDSTQMQQRCTLMHADGPEAGMVLHGRNHTANPGEPRRCERPCPIRVHPRPSVCICVRPCLLRHEQLATARDGTRLAARQAKPHAPIQATVPAARVCGVTAEPHAPEPRYPRRHRRPTRCWGAARRQDPMHREERRRTAHGAASPGRWPASAATARRRQNPMHQFSSNGCSGYGTAWTRRNSHGLRARLAGQETRHCRDAGTLEMRHQRQDPMHQFRPRQPRPHHFKSFGATGCIAAWRCRRRRRKLTPP